MGYKRPDMDDVLVGLFDIAHLGKIRAQCRDIGKHGSYFDLLGIIGGVCNYEIGEYQSGAVRGAAWNDSICISIELDNADSVSAGLRFLDRLARRFDQKITEWARTLLINVNRTDRAAYLWELHDANAASTPFPRATYCVVARGKSFPSGQPSASWSDSSGNRYFQWIHASSWAFANCHRIEETVRRCFKPDCINPDCPARDGASVEFEGSPAHAKFYVDSRVTSFVPVSQSWRIKLPLYPDDEPRWVNCYPQYLFQS